ncbi:hypothetical protein [Billgrantia ethanolica]|uniref:N-acetyltransferase domain-containing protein n=1 Tax=Billgrantia ethanolica TaxID=2733486 RepID=A0ABS9A9G8_9GAMM|nr:hypothetical protein [Halomonas ethanolica]MCE8005290.1 hypothetical protein [Halomonas ethanolica]
MSLIPSLDIEWGARRPAKPSIQVLEVGRKDQGPVFLLVERTEKAERYEGKVCEASISLTYQVIHEDPTLHHVEGGEFSACYHRDWGSNEELVRLSSTSVHEGGYVVVDPSWLAGHKLGTYLQNEIIAWAQQWPEAEVCQIKLLAGQASADNRKRRNRFYEQFGIRFDYETSEHEAGVSQPMKVRELNTVDRWQQNIQEIPLERFLAKALGQIRDQRWELKAREKNLQEIRRDWEFAVSRPVRWTLKRWIERIT